MLGIFIKSFIAFIAPSSSPQNVQLKSLSSTTIEVNWTEVPTIDRNGLIILYEVQYEPNDTLNDPDDAPDRLARRITNTTELSVLLTDLNPFVTYAVSVRAYTGVGYGPYSDVSFERTEEDGKQIITLQFNS